MLHLWDCVIVQELLQFCLPNRGKLWKSLMRGQPGDWEKLARRLREIANS